MRTILILLAVTALGLSSLADAADMTVQPLKSLETSQAEGYSMLVRKETSLLTRIQTRLEVNQREVWWLVFNNPSACAARPCQLQDIYNLDTRADLIRARENEAGADGAGNICLTAGKGGRSLMPDLGLAAAGLAEIRAAEVQVIVTDSVPGLKSLITRRNAGFTSNCAGGECSALLVAVHAPTAPLLVAANFSR